MAHPGRNTVLTEKLDPSLLDEFDPFRRDASLDMFDPRNGPPYTPEFCSATAPRRSRATSASPTGPWSGWRFCASTPASACMTCRSWCTARWPTAQPGPEPGAFGSQGIHAMGRAYVANLIPASIGHYTSLRSWLSQWACAAPTATGRSGWSPSRCRCTSSTARPTRAATPAMRSRCTTASGTIAAASPALRAPAITSMASRRRS